jgi:hypothetical protein
LLPNIFYIKL